MKKLLYIFMISLVTFISCTSSQECVCENFKITESDAKDTNATLEEACNLAKFSDASCSIQ
jgi:hypothetical protein